MATSKSNDKQRDLRFSLATLESMRTHDLAELLSNFVLLLRRLPDVRFSDLAVIPAEQVQAEPVAESREDGRDFVREAYNRVNGLGLPGWTGKE
jgi:hypothetical protein